MITRIYVLTEPDGEIRYIGKTVNSLARRLSFHLYEARQKEKNHRCNWIRSILSTGHLPSISLIGEVSGNGSAEEIAWIAYGRAEKWRLTNLTDGGEGTLGYIPSEETRKKTCHKGDQHWNYGKHHSVETRLKISESKKNPSVELRRKCGEANKGNQYNKGRHVSVESRRKMSDAHSGGKSWHCGKHHSEETKRKMSETKKRRKIERLNKCLSENKVKI